MHVLVIFLEGGGEDADGVSGLPIQLRHSIIQIGEGQYYSKQACFLGVVSLFTTAIDPR